MTWGYDYEQKKNLFICLKLGDNIEMLSLAGIVIILTAMIGWLFTSIMKDHVLFFFLFRERMI